METNFQAKGAISVLIPDGESFFALPTLQCLGRTNNLKIYVLANSTKAAIRHSKYTFKFYSFPKEDGHEGRKAAIKDILKKEKIDLILPIDQPTIRYFAEHGKDLLEYASMSLIPSPEAFDIASDKWLLAEWLMKKNIQVPSTLLYQDNAVFEEKLAALTFPVLIKPLRGDGGIGIKFFDDPNTLITYCKENIRPEDYIVQSFIMGYDIDCSVLCKDGNILASTIQKRIIADPFYFGQTMNLDFLYDQNVYNVVKEVIASLNWSGVVHFDLRYNEKDNQVRVIEMNPRFWGSIVGSFYAGVNFPYLAVLLGLNKEFPKFEYKHIRYVDGKTAVRIWTNRILRRKNSIQYFDYTKLENHWKDPFPMLVSAYILLRKKLNTIFSSKKST